MTEELVFNGIDGETGGYLLLPMSAEDIAKIARGETLDKKHLKELESRKEQDIAKNLGIKPGSREFHELKRGFDDGGSGKGGKKGKSKGKGRNQ